MTTSDFNDATIAVSAPETPAPRVRWGGVHQDRDLAAALGTRIDTDTDLDSALRVLVSLARTAISGADSAGVSLTLGERVFTAVHSDARTLIVDQRQYEVGDGPCLHAARTGDIVRVDAIAAETRWPVFVDAAREENVHSFLAAPLYGASTRFGSLNLYGEAPAAFADADVVTLTSLTGALARALGDYARFDRLRTEVAQLRFALEHRAPIEQAKGILMATHRIDADTAFIRLAEMSQHTNRKLRDVAAEFVAAAAAPARDIDGTQKCGS
ncbi:GAF and ANTAR domain-containing protein [Rhodococcus sp. Eu-32]|uniref:GAF and ANTAR domain-containing protein n=1 Tax=Rhodococcus sp. Eu-32 TaxID=1017319 RepID=UPI001FB51110|nr:GAF and ANTAR domain-containing protein [Rhodococcus sp. Eu-32]